LPIDLRFLIFPRLKKGEAALKVPCISALLRFPRRSTESAQNALSTAGTLPHRVWLQGGGAIAGEGEELE
jgi:hypothetical protein